MSLPVATERVLHDLASRGKTDANALDDEIEALPDHLIHAVEVALHGSPVLWVCADTAGRSAAITVLAALVEIERRDGGTVARNRSCAALLAALALVDVLPVRLCTPWELASKPALWREAELVVVEPGALGTGAAHALYGSERKGRLD